MVLWKNVLERKIKNNIVIAHIHVIEKVNVVIAYITIEKWDNYPHAYFQMISKKHMIEV